MRLLALRTLHATYWEGEGGGGAGGAGGAAGGNNTPPSGNPPPGGPAGGNNTPPAGNDPWYAKVGIASEHHEWLQSKQFADPSTLAASYRNLEGMIGRQRLAVPNGPEDQEARDAIYRTLGRPDKPDGYKLKDGSKITGDAFKFMAPVFHKAGIGQEQASSILEAYEAEAVRLQEVKETERANQEQREITALDAEWGSNAEANKDIAARAFRALGIDEAMSDKIEQAIGYAATMKLFHGIGSGMKEPAFHQDGNKGGKGGDAGTLSAAQNQLKAKFADKDFMEKYMHSDPRVRKGAIEEVEAIQKRIAQLQSGAG